MASKGRHVTENFDPKRAEPCFCGSGERFKHCCGSTAKDRPPPAGLVVRPGWLTERQCDELARFAETREWKWCTTVDSVSGVERRDETRVTQTADMGEMQGRLNEYVQSALRDVAEPEMGCTVGWFLKPHILRYAEGGYYLGHADSEYFDEADDRWYRHLDRDVSLLMYINDGFTGGELYFKLFNYTYRPRRGDLVLFPSDHRYMHQAQPVTSGIRYAIVSWAAKQGEPRLQEPLGGDMEIPLRP